MTQYNSGDISRNGADDSAETQSIISGSMSSSDILTSLGRHGCKDITGQLDTFNIAQAPVSTGGFGDVYLGTLRDGTRVGVKCLRVFIDIDDNEGKKQLKRAARELYVWSKCKHPNILELIGVAKYNDRVAMISPWMENGNLLRFLRRNPNANRYYLCAQIACACAFLRDCGVVHGDIKGANIVVSEDHIPKLTDFGTSAISQRTLGFTATTGNPHLTLRWTAPEIFLGETKHTFEGDVYALGMTILEVFTGSVPYAGLLDVTVMRNLMMKAHPTRPEKHIPPGDHFSDRLWDLITSCWEQDPQRRLPALQAQNVLESIAEEQDRAQNGPISVAETSPVEMARPAQRQRSRSLQSSFRRFPSLMGLIRRKSSMSDSQSDDNTGDGELDESKLSYPLASSVRHEHPSDTGSETPYTEMATPEQTQLPDNFRQFPSLMGLIRKNRKNSVNDLDDGEYENVDMGPRTDQEDIMIEDREFELGSPIAPSGRHRPPSVTRSHSTAATAGSVESDHSGRPRSSSMSGTRRKLLPQAVAHHVPSFDLTQSPPRGRPERRYPVYELPRIHGRSD